MKTKDNKQLSANVWQKSFSRAIKLNGISFALILNLAVFVFFSTTALAQNAVDPFAMDPNKPEGQKSQNVPSPSEGAMINDLDTLFNDAASNAATPPQTSQPLAAEEKKATLPTANPAAETSIAEPIAAAPTPELTPPSTAPAPAPTAEVAPASMATPAPAPSDITPPINEEINPGGLNITTPVAAPPLATVPLPPQTESAPVDSVSGPALPKPAWQSMSDEAPAEASSNIPLPQFDASQSNWKQMEVGQADAVTGNSAGAKTASGNLTSMPQTQDDNTKAANATPQTDQATETSSPTPKVYESEERAQLRHLFSDLLPPESAKASPIASSQETAPASPPPDSQKKVTSQKAEQKNSPAKEKTPLKVEEFDPTPPKPEKSTTELAESGPAILRAGSLLTAETAPNELSAPSGISPNETGLAGAAEIIMPGDPKAKGSKNKSSAKKTTTAETKVSNPKAGSAQNKGSAKKTATSSSTQTKPKKIARPSGQLTIINETGRNGAAESYRSVLTQMGYSVLSVADGQRVATGSTIITYRSGLKGKAQNLARHLPGPKVLIEAKDPTLVPSELLVQIR